MKEEKAEGKIEKEKIGKRKMKEEKKELEGKR